MVARRTKFGTLWHREARNAFTLFVAPSWRLAVEKQEQYPYIDCNVYHNIVWYIVDFEETTQIIRGLGAVNTDCYFNITGCRRSDAGVPSILYSNGGDNPWGYTTIDYAHLAKYDNYTWPSPMLLESSCHLQFYFSSFCNTYNEGYGVTVNIHISQTSAPTPAPSSQPSTQPSGQPSSQPTSPSGQPSGQPSTQPSSRPTMQPSAQPSMEPSAQPSSQPSSQPTNPTSAPTKEAVG